MVVGDWNSNKIFDHTVILPVIILIAAEIKVRFKISA